MKKIIPLLIIVLVLFCLISCESMGDVAGGIAQVAGASDEQAQAIRAVGKGIATFAEAKKAADSLTPENEYYLGRAVAANIAGTYKIYRNAALQTYLNKICSAIVINSSRPDIYNGYHVAVLDTEEINAFATPGGHIFVTRGLIACASNEDALAAVIAHEVAHIQLQHALTSIRNARYVNAAVSGALAGIGEAAGGNVAELTSIMGDSVNEIITTLVVNGYSKNQELEADETALSLLAAAGYQPSGILEMLESLKQKQGNNKTAGFGKTHPAPADRITAVNKNLKKYNVEDTRSYRAKRFGAVI
ncbi:MAG: M48 family metalloprotease [Treponema sp.]|nr:M48 family metalloprotease [Treponema sp.]